MREKIFFENFIEGLKLTISLYKEMCRSRKSSRRQKTR